VKSPRYRRFNWPAIGLATIMLGMIIAAAVID
jgi:hypothetical protein